MGRNEEFIRIFKKVEGKYGKSEKRLAGEGWGVIWKTLIVTIMSAQSRDETTIPIAERLFRKYGTLEKIARASVGSLERELKGMNYFKTKARNIKGTAKMLISDFHGEVPDSIEELVKLPGVGRKTANLVLTEEFGKDGIVVDTHVHRISNVFGFVNTKSPNETELALKKIAPKKYWSRINRAFVLWGKQVPGRDRDRFLRKLEEN
jgi:endonuclease III